MRKVNQLERWKLELLSEIEIAVRLIHTQINLHIILSGSIKDVISSNKSRAEGEKMLGQTEKREPNHMSTLNHTQMTTTSNQANSQTKKLNKTK